MELAAVLATASQAHAAPSAGGHEAATSGLAAVRRLRAWCDAVEIELAKVIAAESVFPQQVIGEAQLRDDRHGEAVLRRAGTCDEVPAYGRSLAAGRVSGEHIDVVGAALAAIEPEHRVALGEVAAGLIGVAESNPAPMLRRRLAAASRKLRSDGGMAALDRQRRDTRLRAWVDQRTGMYRISGHFDPETGVVLDAALQSVIDAMSAEKPPHNAPADPAERYSFMLAHAFMHLVRCGGGPISIDITPVVDLTSPVSADGDGPVIDWGFPVELPIQVLTDWWTTARISPVVLCSGAVIHAPGQLDMGRTTRLANRAQRRAARARHRCCVVPGCSVRFSRCELHHIIWWRHGGRTDFANLAPVCVRHHHQIHAGLFDIHLAPDRTVTLIPPHQTAAPPGTAAA